MTELFAEGTGNPEEAATPPEIWLERSDPEDVGERLVGSKTLEAEKPMGPTLPEAE